MAQIKHIAIATQDSAKTAKFYQEVFGLKQVAELDGPTAKGVFLSDGNINMAILDFKNDQVAGVERGMGFSGIHHIGFVVDDVPAFAEKMEKAGAKRLTPVPTEGRRGPSGAEPGPSNAEVKLSGPDGVIIDISEFGWLGNSQ